MKYIANRLICIASIPLIVSMSWIFGRYGTIAPCHALDMTIREEIVNRHQPKTIGDFLSLAAIPLFRANIAETPLVCGQLLLKHEIADIKHWIRFGYY